MPTFAIDASSANKLNKTGVEMYAFQLIQAMKNHALNQNERVVLYSPTKLEGPLAELPSGWESRVLAWPLRFAWMRARVSWELWKSKPNVLFVPAQGLPIGGKCLTTIHDVAYLHRPDVYESKARKRVASVTRRSIRVAAKLLTVSETVKQDVVNMFRIASDRVVVTPLAADPSVHHVRTQQEIDSVLNALRVGKHFFLYVGRLDKKKNVETLVRAFDQFKKDRGVGDPYELVLVGTPGFGFESVKKWIHESASRESVHVLGYLSDDQMATLMSAATAFVFPSWEEGFGIPNVEAMCSGAPLIVSDIPVHHEVVGDAGLFVPPESLDGFAHAMSQLAGDSVLRSQLRDKGFVRCAVFRWQNTADKTWEVLRTLV